MTYLPGNLPFFKIHVNHFLARDDSPAAHVISMHVVGEGVWCHALRHCLCFLSRLLVAASHRAKDPQGVLLLPPHPAAVLLTSIQDVYVVSRSVVSDSL